MVGGGVEENQPIGVNQTNYVINSQPALSQVLVKEENGVKTFYVYGLGLLGEEKDGEYRSYHFDFRGSTVALTNETGQVTQRFQYAPYGELVSGDATQTPFLFNGMYGVMTDGNGLYYMRARFYSAVIKRFVNMDVLVGSVGEGQTLNRYAFVTGRPVSLVDPFGLESFTFYEQPIFDTSHVVTWFELYAIGREEERNVQELIRILVKRGILPTPHRNSPRDAVRHCTAACTVFLRVGRQNAELMQQVWEFMGDIWENSTAQDRMMDYNNNWCGFNHAETGANSMQECADACLVDLHGGRLITHMELTDPFWTTFWQQYGENLLWLILQ